MTAQEKLPSREVTEPVNLELTTGTFSEVETGWTSRWPSQRDRA